MCTCDLKIQYSGGIRYISCKPCLYSSESQTLYLKYNIANKEATECITQHIAHDHGHWSWLEMMSIIGNLHVSVLQPEDHSLVYSLTDCAMLSCPPVNRLVWPSVWRPCNVPQIQRRCSVWDIQPCGSEWSPSFRNTAVAVHTTPYQTTVWGKRSEVTVIFSTHTLLSQTQSVMFGVRSLLL